MSVLTPAFLWGLLAIAVPVALHLVLRRRVPVLLFPLQRLVQRADKQRQPRKKLNRVLLLLLRAALLALLALSLAQLTFGGGPRIATTGPVAAVVVVDDSLSMNARATRGETLFVEGREAASSFVAALPDGSRVALVSLSDPASGERAGWMSPREAATRIEAAQPTARHLMPTPSMEAALRLLAKATLDDRRMVLVTDLARHAWATVALPAATSRRPELALLVPERESGPNFTVSGLDAEVLPGDRLRVAARVLAHGTESADSEADTEVALELHVGAFDESSRLASRVEMEVGAGASTERRVEIAAPPTGAGVTRAVLPADVLEGDDVRFAVHHVAARPSVLVVDGDPQNLALGSETFYLETALAPGVGLGFDAELVGLAELDARHLEGRAAVVLANVPELSVERATLLKTAVRAGTGLLVTTGNRIDPAALEQRLGDILPATIGPAARAEPPLRVPLVAGGARTTFHMRAWNELTPREGAEVVARRADGAPWLVAGQAGAGRVAVLATTIDRDGNDLPISPAYLPFVRDLLASVARGSRLVVLPSVRAGERLDLSSLELSPGATVRMPGQEPQAIPLDGVLLDAGEPGPRLVEQGGDPRAMFAVVTDARESDLTRMTGDELARRLEPALDRGQFVMAAGMAGGVAAWRWLLLALVVAVALESVLARRAA